MYLNSILLAVIDIKSMCVVVEWKKNLQNEQIWLEISKWNGNWNWNTKKR